MVRLIKDLLTLDVVERKVNDESFTRLQARMHSWILRKTDMSSSHLPSNFSPNSVSPPVASGP